MHTKSNTKMTTSGMLSITAIFVILIQTTLVDSAQGLTRYYNCVTRDANNQGFLSLTDVEMCYDKVFKGAQNADDDGRPLT
ncbi:MAG TPA: hypothetical protein VER14_01210 [Phototrophicaceae bacterium]|nr:hypothetical protein [Phototrophicaceae bacterium]